jgi:hypothetical protein
MVITLRMDALRVLLRGIELLSPRARRERFEEYTARAFGFSFPSDLVFVMPHLGPGDPTQFLGTLLAVADRRSLIERFDEDWFRSPHAAFSIRAEQAELPLQKDAKLEAQPALLPFRARDVEVDAAITMLERLLADLFG